MTFDNRPKSADDHDGDRLDPVYSNPQVPGEQGELSTTTNAETTDKKQSSMVREIVETLILALIIFVAVRSVVLNFRVDGLSMTPSFEDNEMLLVNRNVYFNLDTWSLVDWMPFVDHEEENVVYPFHPPERGDIVVFDAPVNGASKPYIKRVIGLPGETIEIQDNAVFVDGQRLNEPYLEGELTWCGAEGQPCSPVTVPESSVFVLGDNRDNSSDSRAFGPVSVDNIIGKAWVTYWPTSEMGVVPHYDYPEIGGD